jgi:ribosomal protein S27E
MATQNVTPNSPAGGFSRIVSRRRASFTSPSSPLPTSRSKGLMYPVERYLPPAGIYYDQPALLDIFEAGFFIHGHCKVCWNRHPSTGFARTTCDKKCNVCGTQLHKDEVRATENTQQCSMATLVTVWLTSILELSAVLLHRQMVPGSKHPVPSKDLAQPTDSPGRTRACHFMRNGYSLSSGWSRWYHRCK